MIKKCLLAVSIGCLGFLFTAELFGQEKNDFLHDELLAQSEQPSQQPPEPKSLDEVTPKDSTEPVPAEKAEPKKDDSEIAPPKGLGDLAPEKPSTEKEEQVGTPTEFRPPESAISKSLVDKLFVSTSAFRILSASGSDGKWRAGGASDVMAGYKLPWSIPGMAETVQLYGTFRYAPVGISITSSDYSYRGMAIGYYFGALGCYEIKSNLCILGGAELGYIVVNLNDLDYYEKKPSLGNGVNFGLNTGANWKILNKKLGVGPRLYLAFGRLSTVQIGGGASFVF